MKILFILEHYYPNLGGAEVLFKHLAEGLVKKGHKVKVITSRLKGTLERETVEGVEIQRIKVPMFGPIPRHWFTFLAIPTCIKQAKDYDIIQTTTFNAAFPARIAGWLRNKPCIIITHELLGSIWTQLGENWIIAKIKQYGELVITHMKFTKYVCVSKYTRDCARLLGVPLDGLTIINSAVDYDHFKKTEDLRPKLGLTNEFIYMFYGRPGVLKGLETLIQAIPSIKQKIPNSKFLIILANDEPKMRDKYLKLMQPCMDCIQILNPVSYEDLPNYLAIADCVVVPSLSEGFGLSCVEPTAMEIPVVISDAGSLPEVVSEKHTTFTPENPEELAEAVFQISQKNWKETPLKKFEWTLVIEAYEKLYKEVLK